MTSFLLDGVEVCNSFLTQRSYRAAYCELLVRVTPKSLEQALEAFHKGNKFSGLHVSGVADLSFLAGCPGLRYLEVVDQDKVDPRPLRELDNLRGLRLQTPGAGIDFSWFPLLEVFVGDWHPHNSNVSRCRELRQLRVWHFKPKSLDLADLAHTTRLEWLQLTQAGIASLAGLEMLEDLRYLEIAYAPKLESLDALASGRLQVRELELSKAKKIAAYQPLAALPWLRRLKLSSCAPMPDLKWTKGMGRLDFFSFVETEVEDGDLSPLLELPNLRYAGTMNKKKYNYTAEAINELLGRRFND